MYVTLVALFYYSLQRYIFLLSEFTKKLHSEGFKLGI